MSTDLLVFTILRSYSRCHVLRRSLVCAFQKAMWHYSQTGAGRPLILLHGIGMSHAVWNPVLPALNATRCLIAFDIAGFGSTPPLPAGTRPTIANLVDGLARSIHEM